MEALYPSIDQKEGPRIVAEEIRKSYIMFDNIDFHMAEVYLGTIRNEDRLIKEGI